LDCSINHTDDRLCHFKNGDEKLLAPENNARTFGSNRKMPNLHITPDEAKGVVAFLKWMSSIDTNGFPYNFKIIYATEE
jgi:nitric oxide reductase subunit C